jgi:hydroxyacylglutathione hydrolase
MVIDVKPQDVQKLIDDGAILVDVREDQSTLQHKALPGCQHIPLSRLGESIKTLPKDKKKIFFCRSGLLSYQAAEITSSKTNQETYYIEGGLIGYYEQ